MTSHKIPAEALQIDNLLHLINQNKTEQILTLLEDKYDLINMAEPSEDISLLHAAVAANNRELTTFFLSYGADPNIQDKNGVTPVIIAAALGNYDLVGLLADYHANMTPEIKNHLNILQIYKLLQCIYHNDKDHIEKLLENSQDDFINLTDPNDGIGLLHTAVLANNSELVSFLLSHGADPNTQNRKGETPVMMAAELGNYDIFAQLAENNADMKLLDAKGKGVLFYCINSTISHTRCLQTAIAHQADTNNIATIGTHVLQRMCENAPECTPNCLLLLEAGADPNANNHKTGVTALMAAAKAGSLQLVKSILKRGGNPNASDHKGLRAVHYAAMGAFFEVIKVMSAYQADMAVTNHDGSTALHFAAATNSPETCMFLVQRGCNPKLKNDKGLLASQIAKNAEAQSAVKELKKAVKLFDKGTKPSAEGQRSDPATLNLHDWSNVYEAELRHEFGFQTIFPTEEFISILEEFRAPVENSQLKEIVEMHDKENTGVININDFIKGSKYIKKAYLLASFLPKKPKEKKKKEVFVQPVPVSTFTSEFKVTTMDKDHPLTDPAETDVGWYTNRTDKEFININHCVKSSDLKALELAFAQGLSVNVQSDFCKTPLMVACQYGKPEVARFLLDQGADVKACDKFFWTPLHHAALAGHVEIIEMLLNAGAILEARALSGGTPLMKAIQGSKPAAVEFLLNAGAGVTEKNQKGQDCLTIAKDFKDTSVLELINAKIETLPKENEGMDNLIM